MVAARALAPVAPKPLPRRRHDPELLLSLLAEAYGQLRGVVLALADLQALHRGADLVRRRAALGPDDPEAERLALAAVLAGHIDPLRLDPADLYYDEHRAVLRAVQGETPGADAHLASLLIRRSETVHAEDGRLALGRVRRLARQRRALAALLPAVERLREAECDVPGVRDLLALAEGALG